jgi:hypothetical protein
LASRSPDFFARNSSVKVLAPGKLRRQTRSCVPAAVKTSSGLRPAASVERLYSIAPASMLRARRRSSSARTISRADAPVSGTLPSKEGRRRRTASASSSSLNQAKLSKTTGSMTEEDESSSTLKVSVAPSVRPLTL